MVVDPKANIHYLIEAHGNLDCAHWSDGPFCPHCGEREAIRTIHAQTTRPGIYHCLTCRKRFAGVLDISFQDFKVRPRRAPSGGWLSGHRHAGAVDRSWGRSYRVIWYMMHIIRQIIMGSDARPPRRP
ncbi:MAG: transposase [Proteobacteria bacterium]|nr:transposase [Pseudomonadota bacterium]